MSDPDDATWERYEQATKTALGAFTAIVDAMIPDDPVGRIAVLGMGAASLMVIARTCMQPTTTDDELWEQVRNLYIRNLERYRAHVHATVKNDS